MVPSASTEPSCRHVTLTPSSRTKCMSCSTTTTVLVMLISLSSSAVCWVSASVMPATGSSTSSNLGSWASSMPISSHCFCPCDRLPATRERKAFSRTDRKSTRLNSSHLGISYAVFCLKKKKKKESNFGKQNKKKKNEKYNTKQQNTIQ